MLLMVHQWLQNVLVSLQQSFQHVLELTDNEQSTVKSLLEYEFYHW